MQGKEKIVSAHGVDLATEAWGEPSRGTILLVMGATASSAWWPHSLVAALAAGGYRVICFDHRDTGHSTTYAPGNVRYDIFDLAGDIIAILDAYGAETAHLVGMSLGGYVSQIAALQRPERIESLTLIASEPLGIDYEGAGIDPELMAHFGTIGDLDWSDRDAVAKFMLRIAELSAGSAVPIDSRAAMARINLELDRTESMQSAFNHSMVGGEMPEGMTAQGSTCRCWSSMGRRTR